MRKYKQVQRKEVVCYLDEWKLIKKLAASVLMKTGTFIKRMSLDGHITYFNMSEVGEVMKALRIIGANINQIAKKQTRSTAFTPRTWRNSERRTRKFVLCNRNHIPVLYTV